MGLLQVQSEATEGQRCSGCRGVVQHSPLLKKVKCYLIFWSSWTGRGDVKANTMETSLLERLLAPAILSTVMAPSPRVMGLHTPQWHAEHSSLCWTYPPLGTCGHHHPSPYREPVVGAGADSTWSRNFGHTACFHLDCTYRQWTEPLWQVVKFSIMPQCSTN